jgi:hypothetical protein
MAAAPPSADTVWLRIGKSFETQAIETPGSASAAAIAARSPAPPPPTSTMSDRTISTAFLDLFRQPAPAPALYHF